MEMTTTLHDILLAHGQIALPPSAPNAHPPEPEDLATIFGNLTYYGYTLSERAARHLATCAQDALIVWWEALEPALKARTGEDRPMAEMVVYKNFPAEVLAMGEVDYWARQCLMYLGLPSDLFAQKPKPRPDLDEAFEVTVLHEGGAEDLRAVYTSLLGLPARWMARQWGEVRALSAALPGPTNLSEVAFKENMAMLAAYVVDEELAVRVHTATDVLRVAVAMSEGDASLRTSSPLRSFKRRERRVLLGMMEVLKADALREDVARRPEQFKRLFHQLHPGDYAEHYPQVVAVYDELYNGMEIATFASRLEAAFEREDAKVALALLGQRPGEFMRRVHMAIDRFGLRAAEAFAEVVPKLQTIQLLKIERYLETTNDRTWRMFAPQGDWSRVQVVAQDASRQLDGDALGTVLGAIHRELRARLSEVTPAIDLDPRTRRVVLQTNDSDLTSYGRGTRFPLPDEVTFVRTGSYWESGPTSGNIWYDNGWNFFDAAWTSMGACAWNQPKFRGDAAIFSGDPTNSTEYKGRACQLIDLNLDALAEHGVRYAVWNLLCYSYRSFNSAEDVFATLQWGHDPQAGALLEPRRAQLAFPVQGDNLTKYIAYLDVQARELVYMDANFAGHVRSATNNGGLLEGWMPAYLEYLDALPTVHDLFEHAPELREGGMPVRYTDEERHLTGGEAAWVFRPVREDNDFVSIDLNAILTAG